MQDRLRNEQSVRSTRILGSSSQQINKPYKYPWMCSLKTAGFRGQHRCSVTLLSAPPQQTVLVSAAHCNYICKDGDRVVEICCCREITGPTSCRLTSSYCGENPLLRLADESDLEIVCGEHNIGGLPEQISRETEAILKIERIINHPEYTKENGPINGYDISVYLVDDAPLKQLLHPDTNKLDPFRIYPICLPRAFESDYLSEKGILIGWRDPRPHYFSESEQEDRFQYRRDNILLRHIQMERVPCADPNWMNSSTYYPKGVRCYIDPTKSSCLLFGASGSSIARALKPARYKKLSNDRFAWQGPLSLYKGCDQAHIFEQNKVSYGAENPGVFTDGACYLTWVAEQYGLKVDPQLQPEEPVCSPAKGSRADVNRTRCFTNRNTEDHMSFCVFSRTSVFEIEIAKEGPPLRIILDKCKLFSVEGYAENLNLCLDNHGLLATCPSNCIGVDPNAVVVGGTALVAASALGAVGVTSIQSIGVGLFGLATLGGGAMMTSGTCPPLFCRVGNSCRLLGFNTRGIFCPGTK